MKDHDTELRPNFAQTPGELLKEYLDTRNIKVTAFAKRCGRPQKTISEIIAGTLAVTPETALQFERVLGLSAYVWLEFENRYQLHKLQQKELKSLARHTNWINKFPWESMQKKGYLPKEREPEDILVSILNFFGVSSPAAWEAFWPAQFSKMRFKALRNSKADLYAISAWLRRGEEKAVDVECDAFNETRFKEVLMEARSLTRRPWAESCSELVQKCGKAGVAVVFVPDLERTYLRGAAYWASKNKAVIIISDRMKEEHKIWFAFFHEAMHVIHHSKKSIFIDYDAATKTTDIDVAETEADEKAAEAILSKQQLRSFIDEFGSEKDSYTIDQISEFADVIGIDPSLVAARLQHENLLSYNVMSELRRKVSFE